MSPTWKADLKKVIRAKIKEANKDGTVGMGIETLARSLDLPKGAPLGTNAWWVIKENIKEIFRELPPKERGFLLL